MARKPRLTPNQKEWLEITRRLEEFIKSNEEKGIILTDFIIPAKPKYITKKRLQEIANITRQDIEHGSVFINLKTGEVITSAEDAKSKGLNQKNINTYFNKNNNVPSIDMPTMEDRIFSVFYDNLARFRTEFQSIVKSWINDLIREYGRNAVAEMLQKASYAGVVITHIEAYVWERFTKYVSDMMEFLPPVSEEKRQEIFDTLENFSDWEGEGE